MKTLYPYQKDIFEKMKSLKKIALFIKMRLGKTVITLKWLHYINAKRVLILCPKSVMPIWSSEIMDEGYSKDRITIITGNAEERYALAEKKHFGNHFYVTNYETVVNSSSILNLSWDVIVLDESTRIRNPKAKTTQVLNRGTSHVPYKIILSGLPDPESEMDYFEQMKFLHGQFMGCNNFWKWRGINYFQAGFEWVLKRGAREKILNEVSKNAIVLTREGAGLGEKKVYETRYTFMSIEQKKFYSEMMRDFETCIMGKTLTTKFTVAKYSYLAQIASGITQDGKLFSANKFRELLSLLTEELKNESVVIWFSHTHELLTAEKWVHEAKMKCAVYYSEEKRGEEEFKAKKIKIMLAQPRGNQYGIDWSVASTVIYFSNWWDGEIRAQSEDRIVSVKKKEPLLYIDLVCKGTIEEDVVEILKDKTMNSADFLDKLTYKIKQRMEKWNSRRLIQSLNG